MLYPFLTDFFYRSITIGSWRNFIFFPQNTLAYPDKKSFHGEDCIEELFHRPKHHLRCTSMWHLCWWRNLYIQVKPSVIITPALSMSLNPFYFVMIWLFASSWSLPLAIILIFILIWQNSHKCVENKNETVGFFLISCPDFLGPSWICFWNISKASFKGDDQLLH